MCVAADDGAGAAAEAPGRWRTTLPQAGARTPPAIDESGTTRAPGHGGLDGLDRAGDRLGEVRRLPVELPRLDPVRDAKGCVTAARLIDGVQSIVRKHVRPFDSESEAELGHGAPLLSERNLIEDRPAAASRVKSNMAEPTEIEFVFEPQEEGGYHVYAPELPGLHTQGDNLEDAIANAQEALALYVEGLREEGETLSFGIIRRRLPLPA